MQAPEQQQHNLRRKVRGGARLSFHSHRLLVVGGSLVSSFSWGVVGVRVDAAVVWVGLLAFQIGWPAGLDLSAKTTAALKSSRLLYYDVMMKYKGAFFASTKFPGPVDVHENRKDKDLLLPPFFLLLRNCCSSWIPVVESPHTVQVRVVRLRLPKRIFGSSFSSIGSFLNYPREEEVLCWICQWTPS